MKSLFSLLVTVLSFFSLSNAFAETRSINLSRSFSFVHAGFEEQNTSVSMTPALGLGTLFEMPIGVNLMATGRGFSNEADGFSSSRVYLFVHPTLVFGSGEKLKYLIGSILGTDLFTVSYSGEVPSGITSKTTKIFGFETIALWSAGIRYIPSPSVSFDLRLYGEDFWSGDVVKGMLTTNITF